MRKFIYSILMIPFLLVSCSEKSKEDTSNYDEARKIYREAIAIHDEVMPEMGTIMKLKKSLESKKDSIKNEKEIHTIDTTIQALDNAHASMMNWMRNLTSVPGAEQTQEDTSMETITPEEMVNIQKTSLMEIKVVRENINSSMKNARKLLDGASN